MANDNDTTWMIDDFSRRRYTIKFDKNLPDSSDIEILLKVPGERISRFVLREPGIVSFISRVDDDGVHVDIVQPGGRAYTDIVREDGTPVDSTIESIHAQALGLEK